jgi:dCTP deaminase
VILPGHVVAQYVEQGLISVQPQFDRAQLRPFGLRLHLDHKVLIPVAGQRVDLSLRGREAPRLRYETLDLARRPLVLRPGGFALASTIEAFKLHPSLMCRLDGRSTLARLGLMAHCASAVIDSNHGEFRTIVLELCNVGPFEVVLPGGIGIGMATFERVAGEALAEFQQDQYGGQLGVVPPNLAFEPPAFAVVRRRRARKIPKKRVAR